MSVLKIVILTIIIYSAITTIIIQISHENDDVIQICGLGIVGCTLAGIFHIICKIKNYYKYHYNKRSIFENKKTNEKYICRVKDCNDVHWNPNYKLIKRYADKSEWVNLPAFSDNFIAKCKINCNHCKYNKECNSFINDYNGCKTIKCKHDEYGCVTEFDKFIAIKK